MVGSGIVRALLLDGATVVAPLRRNDQIEQLRAECSGGVAAACWRLRSAILSNTLALLRMRTPSLHARGTNARPRLNTPNPAAAPGCCRGAP